MSYKPTSGIGDVFNFIGNNAQTIGDASRAAFEIARDPYFPEAASLIAEMHRLEQPSSGSTVTDEVPGVGLKYLVQPLRAYVALRRNPVPMGLLYGLILFGIPVTLGYFIGKAK